MELRTRCPTFARSTVVRQCWYFVSSFKVEGGNVAQLKTTSVLLKVTRAKAHYEKCRTFRRTERFEMLNIAFF